MEKAVTATNNYLIQRQESDRMVKRWLVSLEWLRTRLTTNPYIATAPITSIRAELVKAACSAVYMPGVRTYLFKSEEVRDEFVKTVPGAIKLDSLPTAIE